MPQKLLSSLKGQNLTRVKVKLPPDLYISMKKQDSRSTKTMWICGSIMGAFMMSPNDPDKKSRLLIPLPKGIQPNALLKCEVTKILKT